LKTFITSSPRWLITFTAIRPFFGFSKGRDVSLFSVAQASRVDFGLQRRFQRTVWVVGAKKIGVANEEALFVVVSVDEPAGDAISIVADDFAGLGFENIDAIHFNAELVVLPAEECDVRLAEAVRPFASYCGSCPQCGR
jgi:hypothetical protein